MAILSNVDDAARASDQIIGALRGVLLDVDGVLRVGGQGVSGAADTLRALSAAGIPHRLLTNATTTSRATLAARLRDVGLPVDDEALLTAPLATAAWLRRNHPGARCFLIAKGDVAADLRAAGVELAPDDADAADVVVVAGAEEMLTYERLDRAFRMLLGGAKLVAMHRNRFWRTEVGLQLDSGPFVRALEEAAGVPATTIGKPALAFFQQGLRALDLPSGTLPSAVVMVGDDAANDLAPARKLGLRTVLVRTGKPVAAGDARGVDLVLDSVAELPTALGLGSG